MVNVTDNAKLSPVCPTCLGGKLIIGGETVHCKCGAQFHCHNVEAFSRFFESHISALERERDEAKQLFESANKQWTLAEHRAEAAEASLAQAQKPVECAAKKSGTAGGNYPADCDWPFCGCDPAADKVVETLQECGWGPPLTAKSTTKDGV